MNITTPYIDAQYYTDVYKPNKNAMIVGRFQNVNQHRANFDAFRNRASEIIDRILQNRISSLGGVEFLTAFEQSIVKKATAAYVEHWFLRGFVMTDLDSTLSIGGLNVHQVIKSSSFREITPMNVLALLQKSSMFQINIFGADIKKAFEGAGITLADMLTLSTALGLFELKGFSKNYEKEIDLTGELTQQQNTTRYVKVCETEANLISFDLIGGGDTLIDSKVEIQHDGTTASLAQATLFIKTSIVNDQNPRYYYHIENNKISVYVGVDDTLTHKYLKITNIYPDEKGEYGLLGSRTTSDGLIEIARTSIFGNAITITGTHIDDTKIAEAEAALNV